MMLKCSSTAQRRSSIPRLRTKQWQNIVIVFCMIHLIQISKLEELHDNKRNNKECPSFTENSACPCYEFDDGLFLECPGTTSMLLRSTLSLITSPIQSLSVYEFDRSVTALTLDLFSSANVNIRYLQFSHSNLHILKDNSLTNLRNSLESLSIVHGKLSEVPTRALAGMQKLIILDFESNEIKDIKNYSFYGLHLVKLNMKGNLIETIPENGFKGLEESIAEIDLSDNKFRIFPLLPLKRLDYLRSLKLSSNEIVSLQLDESVIRFTSLIFLDLSSNSFNEIFSDLFHPFPVLKTLSLYNNNIEQIHKYAFMSLKELQSIDLSHNKIIFLDPDLFTNNKKLHTIDLSHNHIHFISGVFRNLPELKEIFLSENNILEITNDCFNNSVNIKIIYLENNSVQRLDTNIFSTLVNLDQLYLSSNLIHQLPVHLFATNAAITLISLDNNYLNDLDVSVFKKLSNLRELRLNHNKLISVNESLFSAQHNLIELHLNDNQLRHIDVIAFRNCKQLQYLNLQDNQLEDVNLIASATSRDNKHHSHSTTGGGNVLSSLLLLQLNNNRITSLNNWLASKDNTLQILWLENNDIQKLDDTLLSRLIHVEKIYLRNNSISVIANNTFNDLAILKYLDMSYNQLTNLNHLLFIHPVNLETLNFSNNHIHLIDDFAFEHLKKLKVIDLSNNNLKRITRNLFNCLPGASGFLPITSINLRNTNIEFIEKGAFKNLNNLNELNLDDNQLHTSDIQNMDVPSLRLLKLTTNNLSIVERHAKVFDAFPSLQTIVLANCNIIDFNDKLFVKNINLIKIDLSTNALRTIARNLFNGLNVFKELRLNQNQFNEFPHVALTNISSLEILTIAGNKLTNFDFIKLNGLPNLRQLDLRDNFISSLSGFSNLNLPQLDLIDLGGNLLLALPSNFFQNSISIQRLDLSANRFPQIPNSALSEKSLARLSWLNLTGNPLINIYGINGGGNGGGAGGSNGGGSGGGGNGGGSNGNDNDNKYPYLKELFISQTNLTILTSKDFEMFPVLQSLYLIQNRINRVSPGAFLTLSLLQILDLSINEIERLPRERLQGLKLLQTLNVSHNNLIEIEEFTSDLVSLKVLDLSYNQLDRIGKTALKYLINLTELRLTGNRITTISTDGFKTLKRLNVLDMRRNYFETIPMRSLKPIETHINVLRIEDNPLHCSCESQELWEWLRDHQKWILNNENYLKCEQPNNLRGKVFFQLEPQEFCDTPLILKLAIQDIQPYSVIVSWQSREYSGLHGYRVIYHALDNADGIKSKIMNRSANSAKLIKLSSDTRYLICVMGLSNWATYHQHQENGGVSSSITTTTTTTFNSNGNNNNNNNSSSSSSSALQKHNFHYDMLDNEILIDNLQLLMLDTSTTRCTEVRTLDMQPHLYHELDSLPGHSFIHSLLTRRLGLIVGCCLGIIVFIVLVSVLGYLKLKKQRLEIAKRQQQVPPEYISYRHFSIPNEEHQIRDGVYNHHPNFISGSSLGAMTLTS